MDLKRARGLSRFGVVKEEGTLQTWMLASAMMMMMMMMMALALASLRLPLGWINQKTGQLPEIQYVDHPVRDQLNLFFFFIQMHALLSIFSHPNTCPRLDTLGTNGTCLEMPRNRIQNIRSCQARPARLPSTTHGKISGPRIESSQKRHCSSYFSSRSPH